MKTENKNNFKAVKYMRKVRNELSDLYNLDKERYYKGLKKTMADFLVTRKKSSAEIDIAKSNA